jgi:hypothetical protein
MPRAWVAACWPAGPALLVLLSWASGVFMLLQPAPPATPACGPRGAAVSIFVHGVPQPRSVSWSVQHTPAQACNTPGQAALSPASGPQLEHVLQLPLSIAGFGSPPAVGQWCELQGRERAPCTRARPCGLLWEHVHVSHTLLLGRHPQCDALPVGLLRVQAVVRRLLFVWPHTAAAVLQWEGGAAAGGDDLHAGCCPTQEQRQHGMHPVVHTPHRAPQAHTW